MRPLPSCKLDPKVKSVWRISAAIVLALSLVCCAVPFLLAGALGEEDWAFLVAGILAAVHAALAAWFVGAFPPIRFARWRYQVGEHELDIMRGLFWRKRFVIPFIRVQNTDTKQGPIMRAFGLAEVTVATAAGEHCIPGLTVEEAESLRDAIATQARLAREDI
ncbi:MAG: PH domain-containing protein [Coriobacteriia bacterium]|nr:PH domain-containing protein [Coriobacteriia bacterium]